MNVSAKSKKIILGLLSAALLVAVVVGWRLYALYSTAYKGEPVRLYVTAGEGAALRDSLVAAVGDDYADAVYGIWRRIADSDSVSSGSYVIRPGDPAGKTARRIRNRQQDPVRLTFNNLRTMDQLAARVGSQLEISPEAFLAATDSILSARGVTPPNYPAYFIPDTYEFYWTASPQTVVSRLLDRYDRFWTAERRDRAASLGLTPERVATVASIVEEETNKADERPKVARLYLNRLARGMKLQADPTVKFALADFSIRRVNVRHLQVDSPYNTYRVSGLPPGPIRLPEASTLEAVLQSPQHNYLYMCAKEDFSGYHNFAVDFANHQANARRYRAALDRRGIY